MNIYSVNLTKRAERQLEKLPRHIVNKLALWIEMIEVDGWAYAKKIPGFNDEALLGKRFGQRSVRLSRSYRVIFKVTRLYIEIMEVSKHDY